MLDHETLLFMKKFIEKIIPKIILSIFLVFDLGCATSVSRGGSGLYMVEGGGRAQPGPFVGLRTHYNFASGLISELATDSDSEGLGMVIGLSPFWVPAWVVDLSASAILDTALFPYDIFQTGRSCESTWNEDKTVLSSVQYDKYRRLDGKCFFRYCIPNYREQIMQTVHYTHGKKTGNCKTISTGGRMKFNGTYIDDLAINGTFFEYDKETGGDIAAYSNGNLISKTPLVRPTKNY
jgi:hypothetical protein